MLDLTEFKEKEKIVFGKKKFYVPSDLSEDILIAMSDRISTLQNIDQSKIKPDDIKEAYENMRKLIKEILYIGNKGFFNKLRINKFIKGLGYKSIVKITTFISEFINADTKKKES